MHYQFPTIIHINQVKEAIEGSPEFIIAERDHFDVVNYMVSHPDTFPPIYQQSGKLTKNLYGKWFENDPKKLKAIRRECRGLIFAKDGSILARRLHKFFNVGEKDETTNINISKPHWILEKIDGSMITPIPINGKIRFGTKMGITEVSMQAEEFVATRPQYLGFCQVMMEQGWTPIFEWVSRQNRIVIDYPNDDLILLAVRNTVTGEYKNYGVLMWYSLGWKIPLVKQYEGTFNSMQDLVEHTKGLQDQEGYVVRFEDGHMVKIKADTYCLLHKTKDSLRFEKDIIALIINDKMDDLKQFMSEEDRGRIDKFETEFWTGLHYTVARIFDKLCWLVDDKKVNRKTYALDYAKYETSWTNAVVYKLLDQQFYESDVLKLITDLILKHTGSQSKVDSVREIWGTNVKWNYNGDTND